MTEARNFLTMIRCSNHISQRAWQSVSLITSPQSHITYAVAVSTCFQCSPESEWNYSAGRVARPLNLQTGVPAGEPCWLNQNELTESLEFQNTVYGTKYGMKYCEERDVLNELLARPENVPAWHASLYNHDVSHFPTSCIEQANNLSVLCCGPRACPWRSHARGMGRVGTTLAAILARRESDAEHLVGLDRVYAGSVVLVSQ